MNPTRAVRALVGAALKADGSPTVYDLVRTFAQVTDSLGAVLWEAPDGRCAPAGLSIVSLWLDVPSSDMAFEAEVAADPVTALAFDTGSLAVPDDVPDSSAALLGLDVTGALPIDYVDGCHGVLTLLGRKPLAEVFDTVVELVDVLPELCGTVRERQTLALVNACDTILHDADVESREGAVPRRQLAELLSEVCRILALGLHAAEVSIVLEDPAQSHGRYALFAHSDGARAVEQCDPRATHLLRGRTRRPHRLRPDGNWRPLHGGTPAQRHPCQRVRPLPRDRGAAAPLHDVRPDAAASGRRPAQPLLAHLAAPAGDFGRERVLAPAGRGDDVAEQAGRRGAGPHAQRRRPGATGEPTWRCASCATSSPSPQPPWPIGHAGRPVPPSLSPVAHTGNGLVDGASRLAEQTVLAAANSRGGATGTTERAG